MCRIFCLFGNDYLVTLKKENYADMKTSFFSRNMNYAKLLEEILKKEKKNDK